MRDLPVLALTGLLNDERLWQHQARELGHGHPFTVVASTAGDSVAALAELALAQAPAGRFALAGFSLGGYVALQIVRQAPERVAALALVDTSARPDTAEAIVWRQGTIAAVRKGSGEDVMAAFLPRVVHPSRVGDAPLGALLRSMGEAVGSEAFVRQLQAAMTRPDSVPLLRTIRCPTMVVCGREDQITPLPLSEEMAAQIEGARLVVVEQCGHVSPLEQPEAVTAALREWLDAAGA
jgi:pimeloyl-ACP methyl ester carboxylesterase